MGMSLAMFSEVTFKNGRAEQSNYDTYEVARMDSAPLDVQTHIVPHGIDVPASGVGEPGVPPFAPALCNAIFAATGKRIRSLPIGGAGPQVDLRLWEGLAAKLPPARRLQDFSHPPPPWRVGRRWRPRR